MLRPYIDHSRADAFSVGNI